MFVLGLLAALIGNCLIGTGQTIQKYALNQLEIEKYQPRKRSTKLVKSSSQHGLRERGLLAASEPMKAKPSPHSEPSKAKSSPHADHTPSETSTHTPKPAIETGASRFYDKRWLAGFLMAYTGEIGGNWLALSFVSAAIVTPMGIVSVLVNAILAHFYLGETMTDHARQGYVMVCIGVMAILYASPKSEPVLGQSLDDILLNCASPLFVGVVLLILVAISYFIFQLKKRHELIIYVLIQSLLGTLSVIFSKVLSFILRIMATISPETTKPVIGGAAPISIILFSIVACVCGTEYFKQQALSRFPVSRVVPMAYACFSCCAAVCNVIVFKEIQSLGGFIYFSCVFIIAMGLIIRGILWAQSEEHENRKD